MVHVALLTRFALLAAVLLDLYEPLRSGPQQLHARSRLSKRILLLLFQLVLLAAKLRMALSTKLSVPSSMVELLSGP